MRFFDLHCDTLYESLKTKSRLKDSNLHVSIDKGKNYDAWIQCFAVWIPDDHRGDKAYQLFKDAVEELNYSEINQYIRGNDLKELLDSDKGSGAVLTVEGGGVLAGDISKLYDLKKHGVKAITLTWNGSCEIGDGIGVMEPVGLTEFGKTCVQEMEKLDIFVDVSHASEKLFYDVVEISKKPIIATHSNSKNICSHRRNLSNEQFSLIKSSGGIVGVTFCDEFLKDGGNADFSDVLKHIDHFLSLDGENHIAIGSDFDGADILKSLNGIEDVGNLYEFILKHNYKETLVDKIFFKNAYDFFVK